DLVGRAHGRAPQPLAHRHAGHLLDPIGDALQVLDVDRGDHVDARAEDVHDVLPALLVRAGSRHVRVRQLVDEGDLGLSPQHRVKVHLPEAASPVLDGLAWHDLKALDQLLGAPPSMALDEADRHVGTPLLPAATFAEHGIGLAYPRGRTQVDTEVAGLFHYAGGVGLRRGGPASALACAAGDGDPRLLADLGRLPTTWSS